MDLEKEQELLERKTILFKDIKYRQGILNNLKFDLTKEKGFYRNFIANFMKMEDTKPRVYWENNETFGKFYIDHDIELQKDICKAFEKSLNKLKKEYRKLDVNE